MDRQHDGVVLMVESFCGRASPTRSREREREGSSWRLGFGLEVVGRLRPCPPPLYGGLAGQAWPLLQSLADLEKEEWGASFPPFLL